MSALNVEGLISGIQTDSIIQGLMEIQQTQLDRLTVRMQNVQVRQTAFSSLEAQILSLQSAAGALTRSQNNVFDTRSVNVSQEGVLLATAGSRASTGVFQLTVHSLAQAHQIVSNGYADLDSAITEGTFTLRVGNQPEAEIVIDSSNNTLTGLADAINAAQAGVSASIIQDGSTSGTPYRLLLTSNRTGATQEISLTNDLAATAGSAVRPEFDFDNPVQNAQNAQVQLGSGSGAITVESETNQVSNLISGVTLNLLSADPGKSVTVTVQQDAETAVTAVEDFVNAYNGAMEFINQLVKYDVETDTAGVLFGDRTVIGIQNEIRNVLSSVIPGVSTSANRLTAIGISTNDRGQLILNRSRLEEVVKGNVEGISSTDLRRMFALDGQSSNSNIEFLIGSSRTQESTTPYQVVVTQAATRASITGTGQLAGTTLVDSSNNSLFLRLDGAEITVSLREGEYTASELANEVELAINAHPDLMGRQIVAGVSGGGELTLTSANYGNSSIVTILSGTSLGILGLNGGQSSAGTDVAGHFVVNGQIEAATGRGRVLSGDADNAHTADIQLRVTLSPAQVTSDVTADLTVTSGFASRLDKLIGKMISVDRGRFQSANQAFNEQIEGIQKSIDRQQTMFDRQQESLIKQFAALESALAQLQSTSSFLSAQLSGMSG